MVLSYIGPTSQSKTPEMIKRTKKNLKKDYLKEFKNSNSLQLFLVLVKFSYLRQKFVIFPPPLVYMQYTNRYYSSLLRGSNVNTNKLMHVLCYFAIGKCYIIVNIGNIGYYTRRHWLKVTSYRAIFSGIGRCYSDSGIV